MNNILFSSGGKSKKSKKSKNPKNPKKPENPEETRNINVKSIL